MTYDHALTMSRRSRAVWKAALSGRLGREQARRFRHLFFEAKIEHIAHGEAALTWGAVITVLGEAEGRAECACDLVWDRWVRGEVSNG